MIKKMQKTLSAIVLMLSVGLLPVAAFATTTSVNTTTGTTDRSEASCVIEGATGPDSNNTCIANVDDDCTVQNNTVVTINNQNVQNAGTGSTAVFQNTNGGAATSGNASNSNTTVFNGTINNQGNCVVVVNEEPETPVTPAPETPSVPQILGTNTAPKTLPATGSEANLISVGLSAAVLAYICAVRLGRPAHQA